MKLLIRLTVNVLALYLVAYLVPGFILADYRAAIAAAVVIGVINTFIKPIVQLIALPLTIVTLGITAFIINVLLLWGAAYVVPGFDIASFMTAVVASIVLSLVSWFLIKLASD